MRVLSVLLVCALAVVAVSGQESVSRVDLGDRLVRDYGVYTPMPTDASAAKAAGWVPLSEQCAPGLGVAWAQQNEGPNQAKPLTLYFTPAGQAAGVGALYRGEYPANLINKGYLLPAEQGQYYMTVSFRAPADACSNTTLPAILGDRLVINAGPGGIAEELPLTVAEAQAAGWVPGSCFETMGTHWFKDLTGNGTMSYSAANLLPIVLMMDEQGTRSNNINAFFFASSVVQQTYLPWPNTNQWEPIPLPNVLMCKNFCDSKCGFTDTNFYSTLHIYMRDRTPVTCNGGCKIGCCPGHQ